MPGEAITCQVIACLRRGRYETGQRRTHAMSPIDVVRAFLAAAEQKDFESAVRLVSSECEYTNLPMGTVRGPEGIRETLDPFFASIEWNEFKVLRVAADGPVVFVERLDRHLSAHGWWELPVTGVFEVHGGRITVWREYFDLATMQRGMAGASG
jgi:limonene-1,2-epoxide hydrolase